MYLKISKFNYDNKKELLFCKIVFFSVSDTIFKRTNVHHKVENRPSLGSSLYSPLNTQELGQRKFSGIFAVLRIRSRESSGISGSGKRRFSVDPVGCGNTAAQGWYIGFF